MLFYGICLDRDEADSKYSFYVLVIYLFDYLFSYNIVGVFKLFKTVVFIYSYLYIYLFIRV